VFGALRRPRDWLDERSVVLLTCLGADSASNRHEIQ
jgi:hypothetical protein